MVIVEKEGAEIVNVIPEIDPQLDLRREGRKP